MEQGSKIEQGKLTPRLVEREILQRISDYPYPTAISRYEVSYYLDLYASKLEKGSRTLVSGVTPEPHTEVPCLENIFSIAALIDREFMDAGMSPSYEVAVVSEIGAGIYGDHNWKKGIPCYKLLRAAWRHHGAHGRGEKFNPIDATDSLLGTHLGHLLWQLVACIWMVENKPTIALQSKEVSK